MSALRSSGELDAAERDERRRAMRDARYRTNVAFVITSLRSILVTVAMLAALIGWPVPAVHALRTLENTVRHALSLNVSQGTPFL